jgi:hypothetical protein
MRLPQKIKSDRLKPVLLETSSATQKQGIE